MYTNINPLFTYWTVIRSTRNAIARPIQGLDLLMFPQSLVFDSEDLAKAFCDRFNNHQQQSGRVLPIDARLALA